MLGPSDIRKVQELMLPTQSYDYANKLKLFRYRFPFECNRDEIIEEEQSETSQNQAVSNETEEPVEESLPFETVGIFRCIEIDSEQRCWQTHEPSASLLGSPVPLVIDLHGYGFNSTEHRRISDFDVISSNSEKSKLS